jgi:serine/threonine protein kinase/tetratricopeptide (TPR) repeat protein
MLLPQGTSAMSDRSQRAKSIFLEAIDRHARQGWPAFLEQACAGDTELRAAVEKLLRAQAEIGPFREEPAPSGVVALEEPVGECPGTVIGPYKLLQPIGEGGMGTVFMAEQSRPVQRKVALKVIKPGMDSRQVIARFEQERQALALMDHPNIARVLDAGQTGSGRPYFVMELVKGVPITRYCDEHRLTPRQRLELVLPVCQAVQHAHQKGIIHRDLKPSNVLIALYDGRPVPKVIDFGVAKATGPKLTEQTLFTQFGQVVGTLEYMSPEQAQLNQLDVDTRSDIYSLGVLLYELLTGTTPLQRNRLKETALEALLRLIREEEPPRPSTRLSSMEGLPTIAANRGLEPRKLSGLVRGELDWIVMKCLEKDRGRRYETANGLARDLERYLADEPVQACPPSAGYRLKKVLRRHRGAVLAAGVVLLCLLVGVAGTVAGLVRAVRAEGKALAEADSAGRARDRAQQNLQLALRVLDDIYIQLARDRVPREPLQERREHELLKKTLEFYQEFAAQNSTDPAVALEVARARRRVGDIQRLVGQHAAAKASYAGANDQAEQLARDFPGEPEYAHELAACRNALGELDVETGELPSATEQFRRATDLLLPLTRDPAAPPGYRAELARSWHGLGLVLKQRGDRFGVEAEIRKAIDLQTRLAADLPGVAHYRADLAQMHRSAGRWNELGPGDDRAAAEHLRIAVKLMEALAKDFPAEPLHRQRLAAALQELGSQVGPRVENLRRAIDIQTQLAAEYPKVPEYRADLAVTCNNLGDYYLSAGPVDLAVEPCRQTLDLTSKLAGEFPGAPRHQFGFGVALYNWAELALVRDKEFSKASRLLEQAVGRLRPLVKAYPQNQYYERILVCACVRRSDTLSALGDQGGAVEWRREAEEAFCNGVRVLKGLPGGPARVASFCREVTGNILGFANVWKKAGRPAEAAAARQHVAELYERAMTLDPENPGLLLGRADAYQQLGHSDEALTGYEKPAALLEKVAAKFPDDARVRVELATTLYNLTDLLKAKGRLGDAERACRQAVASWRKLAADFPQDQRYRVELGHSLWRLGELRGPLCATGRHAEAEETLREALRLFEALAAEYPMQPYYRQETVWGHRLLSWLFSSTGHPRPAAEQLGQAVTIYEGLIADAPDNSFYRQNAGDCYTDLGDQRRVAGQVAQAEEAYNQALRTYEKLVARSRTADYHLRIGWIQVNLAELFRDTRRPKQAEEAYRSAVAAYTKLVADPKAHPSLGWRLANAVRDLAQILRASGRAPEADQVCRRAARDIRLALARYEGPAAERGRGVRPWDYAVSCEGLGDLLRATGQAREAGKAYRDAHAVWVQLGAESNSEAYRWRLGCNDEALGQLLKEAGKCDEATAAYREASDVWQKLVNEFNKKEHRWHLGCAHEELGHLLKEGGQLDEAAEAYLRALAVWQKLVAEFNNPDYCNHLSSTYGWLLEVLLR